MKYPENVSPEEESYGNFDRTEYMKLVDGIFRLTASAANKALRSFKELFL